MTNHAELSRQLALALGYAPESVRVNKQIYRKRVCEDAENVVVYRAYSAADPRPMWFPFDYRSPDVCLPLLKWLHAVTVCGPDYGGVVVNNESFKYDSLEEAVARAVIAVGVR
jgi:hypothetical protein